MWKCYMNFCMERFTKKTSSRLLRKKVLTFKWLKWLSRQCRLFFVHMHTHTFFFFWLGVKGFMAHGDLNPCLLHWKHSLSHWTTRKVAESVFWKNMGTASWGLAFPGGSCLRTFSWLERSESGACSSSGHHGGGALTGLCLVQLPKSESHKWNHLSPFSEFSEVKLCLFLSEAKGPC